MFSSLSARNFKSWADIPKLHVGAITGLFGTNSSGKSSIIQLLLMLKQTVQSSDRSQVLNLGDERSLVSLGIFEDIVYGHSRDNRSVSIDLTWNLPDEMKIADPEKKGGELFVGNEISFSVDIIEGPGSRIVVRSMRYGFAGYEFGMRRKKDGTYDLTIGGGDFKFNKTRGRKWNLPGPVRFYGFPDQVRAYYQNAGFLADFELALEEQFDRIYYLGPLREYPQRQYTWAGAYPADMGQRGEKVVDAILASRGRPKISRGRRKPRFSVEEYVAYWLRELGMIHDFTVEPITPESNLYRVWVRRTENSARVLITDVGFGVSQILPVIALCYYVPEGSTVILEQPEIHLHPLVQAGLADVFIDAVNVRNIQIVIESHSEHLLRRLQRRIAEGAVDQSRINLYFCEFRDGASQLVPLDLDPVGRIGNWPKDFFGDEFGEIAAMSQAIAKRQLS